MKIISPPNEVQIVKPRFPPKKIQIISLLASLGVWLVAFSLGEDIIDYRKCGEYRIECHSFFKEMQSFSYFPYLKSAELLQNAPSIFFSKPFMLLFLVTPPIIFYGPITWFIGYVIWMIRNRNKKI